MKKLCSMRRENVIYFISAFSQNLSSLNSATWGRGDCIISAPPRTFVKQQENEDERKKM